MKSSMCNDGACSRCDYIWCSCYCHRGLTAAEVDRLALNDIRDALEAALPLIEEYVQGRPEVADLLRDVIQKLKR